MKLRVTVQMPHILVPGGVGVGGGGGVVTEDFVSHRDFVVNDKIVILRSIHWL